MAVGVHDWTRVDDGVFHDFHNSWIVHLKDALNSGVLPSDYFARSELYFDQYVGDVLTLRTAGLSDPIGSDIQVEGAVAVETAPPKASIHDHIQPGGRTRRRSVAVRKVRGGKVVALIEIVSRSNKDRPESVAAFARKVTGSLAAGIHVVVLDLLPPNRHTPGGLHMMFIDDFGVPRTGRGAGEKAQPRDRPVALLSYESRLPDIESYLEYLQPEDQIPDMPLFLSPGYYVNVQIAATYEATFRPLPRVTKEQLDASPPRGNPSRRRDAPPAAG